jgi:hypothetical protein
MSFRARGSFFGDGKGLLLIPEEELSIFERR